MLRNPSLTAAALLALPMMSCAQETVTIPAGTPLWLVNQRTVRLRLGEPVQATVKYPVYVGERVAIPEGATVTGKVTGMHPDHTHRVTSRLRGDFTPFSKPAVEFSSVLIGGKDVPIHLTTVADGSEQTELLTPPPAKGGMVRRQIHAGMEMAKDRVRTLTGPGKRDRLRQYAYTQMPYHPQDILREVVWMPETAADIPVPAERNAANLQTTPAAQPSQTAMGPEAAAKQQAATTQQDLTAQQDVTTQQDVTAQQDSTAQQDARVQAAPKTKQAAGTPASHAAQGPRLQPVAAASGSATPPAARHTDSTLRIQAAMDQEISSSISKAGDALTATVVAPVYRADGSLAVPTGAQIVGTVTRAKAAQRFGRAGVLRFRFTEVKLAGAGTASHLQASVVGMDAPAGAHLEMDSEGNTKPKAQDKVVVPLLLLALAAQPLDREGGNGDGQFGKNAVASNALGMVGFIVGTAGGSPYVASGIGYYGSALSIWNRWIKHGEETRFQRHTRVTLDTTVRETQMLHSKAAGQ